MKTKSILLTVLSSLTILLAACSGTAPASAAGGAVKPYPLNTCIVTDNELGSMGKIITKRHQGQEVKFCCKPCIKKFDANPAKYLAKLPKA